MCLDTSAFFDKSWLDSINEEEPAPVQVPEHEYAFPLHLELDSFYTWAAAVPVQAPEPVTPPEPEWSRARADVFVLSIETELYASVMYDKRKMIHQHALSQL